MVRPQATTNKAPKRKHNLSYWPQVQKENSQWQKDQSDQNTGFIAIFFHDNSSRNRHHKISDKYSRID
jgi:hypothetical protein